MGLRRITSSQRDRRHRKNEKPDQGFPPQTRKMQPSSGEVHRGANHDRKRKQIQRYQVIAAAVIFEDRHAGRRKKRKADQQPQGRRVALRDGTNSDDNHCGGDQEEERRPVPREQIDVVVKARRGRQHRRPLHLHGVALGEARRKLPPVKKVANHQDRKDRDARRKRRRGEAAQVGPRHVPILRKHDGRREDRHDTEESSGNLGGAQHRHGDAKQDSVAARCFAARDEDADMHHHDQRQDHQAVDANKIDIQNLRRKAKEGGEQNRGHVVLGETPNGSVEHDGRRHMRQRPHDPHGGDGCFPQRRLQT